MQEAHSCVCSALGCHEWQAAPLAAGLTASLGRTVTHQQPRIKRPGFHALSSHLVQELIAVSRPDGPARGPGSHQSSSAWS